MSGFGSIEAVIAAIREDALSETTRIDHDAEAAIERLRREDAALPIVVADAEVRIAAARRAAREQRAAEDWADRQSALRARDAWIAAVLAAGLDRLSRIPAEARRADLLQLAREAIGRIGAAECRLLIAPADEALADADWQDAVRAATGTRFGVVPSGDITAGCIAETTDGRLRFDNTLAARIRRFEPQWRHALGTLFQRGAPAHA